MHVQGNRPSYKRYRNSEPSYPPNLSRGLEGPTRYGLPKCQAKLKHGGKKNGLAKLKKALKKRARQDEQGPRLHVVDVSCLKMCPKGGVTVCTQQQLEDEECSIMRTRADVEALILQYRDASAGREGSRKSSALNHVQREAG